MVTGSTLPGTDTGGNGIILHVDLDCFYAACERRKDPSLEGEPVVVGMGFEPGSTRGAVATASYEAREYGIESAQPISTALETLPRAETAPDDATDVGYYRPVDMEYYESVAAEIKEILKDSADVYREVSIDEAYLDVTDRTNWDVAAGYARYIRDRIEREVGLTASVGVAPTMAAAKIASDHDKPRGLVVVQPEEVTSFLAPLPIEDLHGVGPVTAGALRESGIETIGDLADASAGEVLDDGERARELHRRARGLDEREVEPRGRPKSLSRESSLDEDAEFDQVRDLARSLATAVAERATSKGAMYQTIGIKVVTTPYDVNTRARSLPGPVDEPDLVESISQDLLDEFAEESIRKVGVRVSNLSFAGADQSKLESWDDEDTSEAIDGNTGQGDGETGQDDGRAGKGKGRAGHADGGTDAGHTQLFGQTRLDDFLGERTSD